jgi:hypothetical protein
MAKKTETRSALSVLFVLVLVLGILLFSKPAFAASADKTAPVVEATLSGDVLEIKAYDDASGIAAVFIDNNRVNTLIDGTASVKLKDWVGGGRQVMVYAIDAANNRSKPALLDNPYYQAPAVLPAPLTDSTLVPASASATGNSEAQTAGTSAAGSQTTVSGEQPAVPSAPTTDGSDDRREDETTASSAQDDASAFSLDGSGTVIDNAAEGDGKEFFTITASDDTVYYLIIDRQRNTQNVYFLTPVSKDDLISLADSEQAGTTTIDIPVVDEPATPQPTTDEPESPPADEPEQTADSLPTIIFILIAAGAAAAAGLYFKIIKPRRQAAEDAFAEGFGADEDDDAAGEDEDEDEYYFEEVEDKDE